MYSVFLHCTNIPQKTPYTVSSHYSHEALNSECELRRRYITEPWCTGVLCFHLRGQKTAIPCVRWAALLNGELGVGVAGRGEAGGSRVHACGHRVGGAGPIVPGGAALQEGPGRVRAMPNSHKIISARCHKTYFEVAHKIKFPCREHSNPPSRAPEVPDLHVEEGQEGVAAERAGGVEVGVVCRPAGHDLLVVHQAVTRLAARTAGDQQLRKERGVQKQS